MKKVFLMIGFVFLGPYGFTQEVYIGLGLGGALPLGDYSGLETEEGDFKNVGFAEHGYTMKFIDAQYRFYKNIGVSYSWWHHNHSLDENAYTNEYRALEELHNRPYVVDTETDDDYWAFSTHTIGLFLSTFSRPFDFNVKASAAVTPGVRTPELNVAWTDTSDAEVPEGGSNNTRSAISSSKTGLSLGVGGKYYINDHWAITAGIDYFTLQIELPERRVKITTDATGSYYIDPAEKEDLKINFMTLSFGVGYIW